MNRVEFFLDNQKIGESTVAPYTLRWNIVMTDTPILHQEVPLTQTVTITQPDGTITTTGYITVSEVLSITQTITDPVELANWPADFAPEKWIGYQKVYSGGFSIISTTLGYTETHLLHVIAFDSAGNETKTEPISIRVMHKKEEEEEGATDESQGYLLPPVYRDRALLAPPLALQQLPSGLYNLKDPHYFYDMGPG